jgi:predicted solute-binding protein
MNNPRDILLKILEAIDYRDNREAFADEFIQNTHLLALVNLVKSLPDEKQTEVKQQLSESQDNPEKISAILNEYFSQEELPKALENAAKDAVIRYIQTITPTLSQNQKEKLFHVMEEVRQAQAA